MMMMMMIDKLGEN